MATPSVSAGSGDLEVYRCNTPNGYSDGVAYPIYSTSMNLTGKLLIHAADVKPEWASIGKILLHLHGSHFDDGDCGCNGIEVRAFKNPDQIELDLTTNGKNIPIAHSLYDTPISFSISVSPQGLMTVAIGESKPLIKTATLLHPEHDTVEMSCSGTDISFLNIVAQ
jgi:hypothetical protein